MKKGEKRKRKKGEPFTTGEVAKMCRISIHKVIDCVKKGLLHATRINSNPRSQRRISHEDLVPFMRGYNFPEEWIPRF